ncbi:hypothetical protein XthCFBP4691_18730 [Xanthomonas theicola]|uniref:Uncharacterized protein n=1 Tax=Xanthomonas theicola TaxID=56464 RepID=A0A2S6ZAJ1_9XANT|nr:hypothetical protein [Xanthomonas theicola]PPT79515.1 hypothetical protein XthCFBP4691_18730 [Xanthomonas theicola]QNH23530.1 hypothetical protein G4Q83_00190 [Xanthomonas theicola]
MRNAAAGLPPDAGVSAGAAAASRRSASNAQSGAAVGRLQASGEAVEGGGRDPGFGRGGAQRGQAPAEDRIR